MKDQSKSDIQFTNRQVHILQLWEECATTDEIAEKLNISANTVITHLRRMRGKLGVRRTFEVYKHMKQKNLFKSE